MKMGKLKDGIKIEQLKEYGFVSNGYEYRLSIGAFALHCNIETKQMGGCGFYPVGDRIVMRQLIDLGMGNLIIQN